MASKPAPLATGVPNTQPSDGKEAADIAAKGSPPTSSDSANSSDDEDVEGDYGSQRDHIFSDPKVADYWRGVYETAQYEGRHRFDPTLTWTAKEEKALRRKVTGPASMNSTRANGFSWIGAS